MKKLILYLFCFLFIAENSYAEKNIFEVTLYIPPQYNKYEAEVTSFMLRELREIKDVEIVKTGWDYFITVVPAPFSMSSGYSGVAVSYVIMTKEEIIHDVKVVDTDDLKKACERIIAFFDVYVLEPQRK